MKTIEDAIKKFMAEKGYDGLFNPGIECQCYEHDLCHCDTPWITCRFGYLKHFDDDISVIVAEENE